MSKRTTLLTTAAAAALVGAMTSGAWAFDTVDWNWQNTVTSSTVDVNIDVDLTITDPTALAQVESFQANVGNLTATANTGEVNVEPNDESTPDIDVEGILTSATAVANNVSIDAAAATLANIGQFAYGTGSVELEDVNGYGAVIAAITGGNPHLVTDQQIMAGEVLDFIEPAAISAAAATSNADAGDDPVQNLATGVANNANLNVASSLLIGDAVQVAIANVAASATVSGAIGGGSLENAATAVGNNLKIAVGAAP